MSFLAQHQSPQQSTVLLCPRHQEYVKGICLFNGYCPERLVCRVCRRYHDNNHLSNYEELDDLLEGNLVNDILNNYDQLLKRLDHQIITYQKENQHTVVQIDNIFAQIQEYVLNKLNETRNVLIEQINKKIKAQVEIKNSLVVQMHEIQTQYKTAVASNFQPSYVVDNFVDTIIKAQNMKTSLINDPNFNIQTGSGLNTNLLSPTASANLIQFVKTFQDKVCSDIVRSFNSPEKLVQPQGHYATSTPINLGTTPGPIGAGRSTTPQGGNRSTLTPTNIFSGVFSGTRGQPNLFTAKSSGQGKSEFGYQQPGTTFQPGTDSKTKYSPFGLGHQDQEKMQEEIEHAITSFRRQHTPHKLLEMFKLVDQQEKDNQNIQEGPRRSIMKGSGRGRTSYSKGNHSLDSRTKKTPSQHKRNKSEEKRNQDVDSVVYNTTLTTEHRQIMFGGLAYVPSREQLITSGTDGWLEVWSTKDPQNPQRKSRLRAHNSDIFKIKYIPEKDILLSTGVDGTVNVWRFKNNKEGALEFVIPFKKHQGPVFALEYLPDLNLVVSGGEDEHLRVWKSETAEEMYALKTSGTKIGSLCLLKKINRVAAGFDRGHINVIEMNQKTRKVGYTIKAHSSYVLNLVSIEERNILVSAADDGYVKVWKVLEKHHQLLISMQEPNTTIRGLAVFNEKDLIISNHDDKNLMLWRLSTGKNISSYRDKSFGEGIVILKNKEEIATGSDRSVKLWSIA